MSIESAKAFVERMKSDEDFKNRVAGCKDPQERMALVEAEGFKFTPAEVESLKSELTEEDLNKVAGGSFADDVCKWICQFWG